ncbi:F0F1 ATP synthase subunit A [Bacteroidales bacterium OttesenSCG-928-K03]|nr:F0F1 ATP synthase subunit A [Odoribacter sp. OttesenSCG-928-L07]MDL2239037.1 F0F1 ATP synthase subunit A [Bacteroidales bacterium OttesenSCG-928-L14]MDL2240309.1 F0F1 ATP synthase subunit A [Bacteroidales bacterium OttesenSCG-928-K22]MDL2242873.1 F0F1 ATP synthase subunit A [Bacteroidales bacterium OttesenSCG-928-K03]
MKKLLSTILVLLITSASLNCFANSENEDGKDLNVSELIFDHTGDSYEWHIITIGEKHISIPLPVIVISKHSGLNIFLSSKLHHHNSFKGFTFGAEDGKYEGKIVEVLADGSEYRPFDISITKNVVGLFITITVLLLCVFAVVRWYKNHDEDCEAPRGFRGAFELLIMDVHDNVIKPSVGANYKKFAPYLLTAFFFIFISNLLGLVPIFPGGANLTGNIAITFTLAMFTFFIVNIFGTKEYWKEILWPDVPMWLKAPAPIMPIIEIFGIFTKPFALMIRLFANILAGHAIIIGLCCLVFVTASLGAALNSTMTVVSILFMVFMNFLEILVAYIQAYVFTLLSAVFIGLAQVQPHNHKKLDVK